MAFAIRNEVALFKLISMRSHLLIDCLIGIGLAVSPWILGFYKIVWLPHILCGILVFATARLTRKEPHTAYAHPI